MKIVALLMLLCLVSAGTKAQDAVKRFCDISVNGKKVRLNYGQSATYTPFKDSLYVNTLRKVESLTSLVSVLNYMSDLGWKYEWAIPDVHGSSGSTDTSVRILFSREFDRSALIDQPLRRY